MHDIKKAIETSFLRVIKNNDLYTILRKASLDISEDEMDITTNRVNFSKLISSYFEEGNHRLRYNGNPSDFDYYELISNIINMLLRKFLEENGVNMFKIGFIGHQVFNMTCIKLYGDRFISDNKKINEENGNVIEPTNEKEAFFVSQFMQYRMSENNEISYDEFMKTKGAKLEQFYNTHIRI